jgi:exonuclease VII small subunit
VRITLCGSRAAVSPRTGDSETYASTVDNLEEELDGLYGLEPESFVTERDRLVRDLRAAGERETAEQVKQLRKPTVAAWTINQLARQERRDIDLLLDAGHRLREAHEQVLAGEDPGRLTEARRAERDALNALHKAARRILADTGRSEATLTRVIETLQAAAVSVEGRELLARGRLTGELEATGFDLLAPLAGEAPAKRTRRRRKPAPARGERSARRLELDRMRLEDAQRELRDARDTAKALEKKLRAAEQAAGKARKELSRAEEDVQAHKAELREARTAVNRAEKQVNEAQRKVG